MMRCSKPALFALSGEWKRSGMETAEQVRHELLWRLASAAPGDSGGELEAHASECSECRALLESFRRLALATRKREAVTFAACPRAEDLAAFHYAELSEQERAKVQTHMSACAACREEAAWIECTAAQSNVVEMPRRRWPIFAAVAAAAAFVAFLPIWRQAPPASPFAGLAQTPALDRADLAATLTNPERTRRLLDAALSAFEAGDYRAAEANAHTILVTSPEDPSALLIVALARLQEGDMVSAERAMYASESARPMTHYRCWTALQMALLAGNRARIDIECRHLDSDPAYSDRTRRIHRAVEQRSS